MQTKKIRDLTWQEMQQKLNDYERELFNLRFQHATGQLGNTQRLPKVRKNIARIKTILREQELEGSNEQ
ncbi:MAG: 50S ribosomal protein L29 [Desulfohalobiaceae bacterium]